MGTLAQQVAAVRRELGLKPRYTRAVAAAFDRFAGDEPARFRKVDASGGAEAVTARLLAALDDLVP